MTGGEFVRPQGADEVLASFATICRDIRSRYSIGYVPALEDGKKLVHKVKVTAKDDDGRKLSVLTRTSYTTVLNEQFAASKQKAQQAP